MHHEIDKLLSIRAPKRFYRVYGKAKAGMTEEAIASAEKIYQAQEPNTVFNYVFLDETYDRLYKTEQKSARLLGFFSLLASLISCLGIFGLATYKAKPRTKEISIRKTLGATVAQLSVLLSRDFLFFGTHCYGAGCPDGLVLHDGLARRFCLSVQAWLGDLFTARSPGGGHRRA